MFKKIKKIGLKFLVISLTYILSFSTVNAMENIQENSGVNENVGTNLEEFKESYNNYFLNTLLSIRETGLKLEIYLGYKLDKARKAIDLVKDFKNYIINNGLTMKKIEDENILQDIQVRFVIEEGKKFRNDYKEYQKRGFSRAWNDREIENRFTSLNEFTENVTNVETLKKYLEDIITKLSNNGEFKRDVTSLYDEILSTIEKDKDNVLKDKEKIKNSVNEAFVGYMSKCEKLMSEIERLREWFNLR